MANHYLESIKFVHSSGDIYTFKTEPNPLNGAQMYWFEPQNHVATMFKDSEGNEQEAIKTLQALEKDLTSYG